MELEAESYRVGVQELWSWSHKVMQLQSDNYGVAV